MNRFKRSLKKFAEEEAGTDMVEFAMAAAILGAGAVISLNATNSNFSGALSSFANFVTSHL